VTTSEREVVAALARAITQRIGEPRYQLWFADKTKLTWHEGEGEGEGKSDCEGEVTVGVPNHFYQEWLKNQFVDVIRTAAEGLTGAKVVVRFVIDPELFQAARREEMGCPAAAEQPPAAGVTSAEPHAAPPRPEKDARRVRSRMRRWRRLEDFVAGACNRVAYAAALSVGEAPGQGPNPLVLHGPVGTGKTHLLEGIYLALRKQQPSWQVVFAAAEEFTNRFLPALRAGKLAGFRKHFRDCDALLLDDLHFLIGKRATQEELLHTFDALQAESVQVVLTCDCHPRLTEGFLPELVDRLAGGAAWGLTQPDAATRLALLQSKAGKFPGSPVPDAVLRFLAEQLRGNVRELEGALHSLRHCSAAMGQPIDLNMAREALGDLLRHSIRIVRLEDIDRALCGVLRLDAGSLQSKQRAWSLAHPRMLAVYLARKHTAATHSEVGAYFGGRNHSTAVAAEKKTRQWVEKDAHLTMGEATVRVRDVLERVERELTR
jgi:chromosomal replication initiator protein